MKKLKGLMIVISIFIFTLIGLPAQAHGGVVLPAAYGVATIDGDIGPNEWTNASYVDFPVNIPGGGTTPGRVYAMNDGFNLYLAIRFERSVIDAGNAAVFEFDNNHDGGVMGQGDDCIVLNPDVGFADVVRWPKDGMILGILDTDVGGTSDGAAAFGNNGTYTVYEFAHPLNSADDACDFSLSPGQVVGFCVFIRMIGVDGFGDTEFPTTATVPWGYGDIGIAPAQIPVIIDIKPGNFPNSINLTGQGLLPVAILGVCPSNSFGAR